MKTKVKILLTGGSYYETDTEDTIHWSCRINNSFIDNMPSGGTTIVLRTWDNCGERETLAGNTKYSIDGYGRPVVREYKLTIIELVKELLNLP